MNNFTPKKGLALMLVGGVVVISTKYKEIVSDFSADPVPFILFPVLTVVAWFIYKRFGHMFSDEVSQTNQKKPNRPNDENW